MVEFFVNDPRELLKDPAREEAENATWLMVLLVTLGTTLCAIENWLTNANMIYMVGTLGITPDEFTWIIAGFIAAQLVGICLTDRLLRTLSLRNYLLWAMAAFVGFELLAAHSPDYFLFSLSRLGAGFVNGSITTASLILIMRKIPANRRLLTYFFFGAPAVFAVPFAFLIGGFFIENYNWRYIYEFAAVPGALLFLAFYKLAPKSSVRTHPLRKLDWLGLGLLVLSSASYAIMMLRGTTENWLDSPFIQALLAINIVGWSTFFYQQLNAVRRLLKVSLLTSIHFLSVILLNALFGFILCYTLVIAGFLVLTQDCNSIQIGTAVLWAGISVPFVLARFKKLDFRQIMLVGTLFFLASGVVNSNLTRLEDGYDLLLSQFLRAIGQTLFLWPLWNLTILETKVRDYEEAAKLYTFSRVIGTAAGIGAVGGVELWRENFHSTHVTESLTDSVFHSGVAQMKHYFVFQGSSLAHATKQALVATAKHVRAESLVLTYGDTFWLLGMVVLIALIPLFFVKSNTGGKSLFELVFRREPEGDERVFYPTEASARN